jgi:hypothetical protein
MAALLMTSAASASTLVYKLLLSTDCNTENWCWAYDGQTERLYENAWDDDGDGDIDRYTYNIQEGSCCDLN